MFKEAHEVVKHFSTLIRETPDVCTVILAGNKVLSPDGGYAPHFGVYPETAWQIGVDIARAVRDVSRVQLVVLINDWNRLKGRSDSKEIRERYWADPAFDLRAEASDMASHLLDDETPGRLSEQAFHNQYARIRRSEERAAAIDEVMADLDIDPMACNSEGQCDAGKCASEYVMLLRLIHRQGIGRLISFVPDECSTPIETGSKLFCEGKHIFSDRDHSIEIHNLFMNVGTPKNEADVFLRRVARPLTTHRG